MDAHTALHTAYSFFRDVIAGLEDQKHSDPKQMLKNVTLAAQQIQLAEQLDPTATIKIKRGDDGSEVELDIPYLKAMALLHEGQIHHEMNQFKKAITAFETATRQKPNFEEAWYWLALAHGQAMNKNEAIDALQHAIQLDPANHEYRKAMERAKAITGSQIALDRAGKVIDKTGTGLMWLWGILWLGFMAIMIYNVMVLFDAAADGKDKLAAVAALIVTPILGAIIFPVLNFLVNAIKG